MQDANMTRKMAICAPSHNFVRFLSWYSYHNVSFPSPPVDIIWATMIVWRIRGKIIRTVLSCCVWQLCAMIQTHKQLLQLTDGLRLGLGLVVVCSFRFSILCVFLFLVHSQVTIIFVVSVCLSVCLCRVFLSRLWSDFDQTRTYVICLGLVMSPRI